MTEQLVPEWADPAVPEDALDPQGVSRRGLIRGAFDSAIVSPEPPEGPVQARTEFYRSVPTQTLKAQ